MKLYPFLENEFSCLVNEKIIRVYSLEAVLLKYNGQVEFNDRQMVSRIAFTFIKPRKILDYVFLQAK